MDVVDHRPGGWFLVRDGDALLLDVHCSHGAVDYSVALELDEVERRGFAEQGAGYLDQLSEAIHYSAPGVRGSDSPYRDRLLPAPLSRSLDAAIAAWVRQRRG